jgi:hypothetical protein
VAAKNNSALQAVCGQIDEFIKDISSGEGQVSVRKRERRK